MVGFADPQPWGVTNALSIDVTDWTTGKIDHLDWGLVTFTEPLQS